MIAIAFLVSISGVLVKIWILPGVIARLIQRLLISAGAVTPKWIFKSRPVLIALIYPAYNPNADPIGNAVFLFFIAVARLLIDDAKLATLLLIFPAALFRFATSSALDIACKIKSNSLIAKTALLFSSVSSY